MILRSCLAFVLLLSSFAYAQALPAGEYAKHFRALEELSVAVANAMPVDQLCIQAASGVDGLRPIDVAHRDHELSILRQFERCRSTIDAESCIQKRGH